MFYRKTTRLPPRSTGFARRRRANNSFQNFGGVGSLTIRHIFTSSGIEIESRATGAGTNGFITIRNDVADTQDQVLIGTDTTTGGIIEVSNNAGTTGVQISSGSGGGSVTLSDDDGDGVSLGSGGVDSPEINDIVINSNTTLNTSVKNRTVSLDFSSSGTITLAANTSTFRPGTYLVFQDISGNASSNPISFDPNNGSSGKLLDGGTGAKEIIDTDYGTVTMRLIRTNTNATSTNWFTHQPPPPVGYAIGPVNTNTTMAYPFGLLTADTSAGALLVITLPDANKYKGRTIHIKKTTTDANTLSLVPASGQKLEGVNTALNSTSSKQGYVLSSNGNLGWWVTGAYNI